MHVTRPVLACTRVQGGDEVREWQARERERQYLYQHVISSWVVNAWNYRMSIVLVNSLIIWIFHWGQLLACLLINLIAAARMSCSSVSWREREFVQAAESRAAPTLLVGLLQGKASNLDWIIMIAWRMLSCSSYEFKVLEEKHWNAYSKCSHDHHKLVNVDREQ